MITDSDRFKQRAAAEALAGVGDHFLVLLKY